MTTRKRFIVTTEARQYSIDLSEEECEQVRHHYHGFVKINEVVELDFEAIAQELHEGSK